MKVSEFPELVSVGIPVVKTTFLAKTLACCMAQTHQNLEIIVVNNASNVQVGDEIEEIVRRAADPRIMHFRNATQLPMLENWNLTFSYAKGEFFSLLCDDDFWEPEYVETMLGLANKYLQTHVFHSRVLVKNDKADVEDKLSELCPEHEDAPDFIYHRLLRIRTQYVSDFLARTTVLKEIGGFVIMPDAWGSDDLTWFKLAAAGDGVAYSQKVLFVYNDNAGNVSNTKNQKNKYQSLGIYVEKVKEIMADLKIPDDQYFELKKKLIINELSVYFKKGHIALFNQRILSDPRIPNALLPLFRLIYKFRKKTTGW